MGVAATLFGVQHLKGIEQRRSGAAQWLPAHDQLGKKNFRILISDNKIIYFIIYLFIIYLFLFFMYFLRLVENDPVIMTNKICLESQQVIQIKFMLYSGI